MPVPQEVAARLRLVEAVAAPVQAPALAADAVLKINLPGGAVMAIADGAQAALAAHLLKALAASSSC